MGCNCGKKKLNGQVTKTASAARHAVYQVVNGSGQLLSEHSTPQEARKAAVQAGGRVRITSKASQPAPNAVT